MHSDDDDELQKSCGSMVEMKQARVEKVNIHFFGRLECFEIGNLGHIGKWGSKTKGIKIRVFIQQSGHSSIVMPECQTLHMPEQCRARVTRALRHSFSQPC